MNQRRRPHFVSPTLAALFGALVALALLVLVVPLPAPLNQTLQVGDVAPRSLSAAHDANFVSQVATNAARDEAAAKIAADPSPYAHPADTTVAEAQVSAASQFLAQVAAIRGRENLSLAQKQDQVNILGGAPNVSANTRATLVSLSDSQFSDVRSRVVSDLDAIMRKPILPASDPQTQSAATNSLVVAFVTDSAVAPPPQPQYSALVTVLDAFVIPNTTVDQSKLEAAEQAARKGVKPVTLSLTRGQSIVTQGDTVDAGVLEKLKAGGVIGGGYNFWDFAGGALLAGLIGLALAVYTWRFQPFATPVHRRMLLIGLVLVATLAVERILFPVLTPDSQQHYLAFGIPVAAAAMVAAAFADLSFAALVATIGGLFAVITGSTNPELAGSSFTTSLQALALATTYITTGLAGAVVVARAERLGRYAVAAVVVAVVAAAAMVIFWLIGTPRSNVSLIWIAVAAGINGVASAAVALTIFVLLAMAFGITTRLQLLELTQSDNPLLRRLQDEAPGTYHHSMMVGALAERGADRIGADSLLARAGAYYHDIGKLAKPGFYVENMLDGATSPHDGLSNEASARIIREHVTSGIDMARRYHLPDAVRAFIPQHHGTRLVTYFYRKAVQAADGIDPEPYRYTGPRPQTREAAIVMLADSCEAVVRAGQGQGQDKIEASIDAVFAERLAEGQLDECDITLRELQDVAASFKSTLRAVYHPRLPYPDPTPEEIAGLARGDSLPGVR
jgi:putative nucleotidyltransferase with HDIG domain